MHYLLFFLLPIPFFAVCAAMIAAHGILGTVHPDTIDRQTFARIVQLRDFRQFSPDLVERLTRRGEQEFGSRSPNPPILEMHPWEKSLHSYFQKNRSVRQSRTEINLTAMAKIRYFQWMNEYHAGTLTQKAALMNDVVNDVHYWQRVYFDYLRFLDVPEPTLAELYQDFQRMIEDFKEDASPEEKIQIDSFAQDLSRTLFTTGVQKTIMDFFPFSGRQPQ